MRSRRRTHHSHVAWSGSDEEFQAQTPQPAWDAAWDRVRAERKQAGLPNTYTRGRFAKPLDWETGLGGSNPPLSALTTKPNDNPAEGYKHPTPRSIARWLIDGVDQASTALAQGNGD